MNLICVDACYLIALYDPADENHAPALDCFLDFFERRPYRMLLIWPIIYETLATRMARRGERVRLIEKDWIKLQNAGRLEFVDDKSLRDTALAQTFAEYHRRQNPWRSLSLADRVVRGFLESRIRIDALLTFNAPDFNDVCKAKRIPIEP